jgi:hypothetical protein
MFSVQSMYMYSSIKRMKRIERNGNGKEKRHKSLVKFKNTQLSNQVISKIYLFTLKLFMFVCSLFIVHCSLFIEGTFVASLDDHLVPTFSKQGIKTVPTQGLRNISHLLSQISFVVN